MRKMIAAMQVSLDGFMEGPNGELDWVPEWNGKFDNMLDEIDTCVLGGGMYPGYEAYWTSILANPNGPLEFTGAVPTKDEVTYAQIAGRLPHFVLSSTLDTVKLPTATIVHRLEEISQLKQLPGKSIYVVGGPTLLSSLFSMGLIDELRLLIHPLILGKGKTFLRNLNSRYPLELVRSSTSDNGMLTAIYRVVHR